MGEKIVIGPIDKGLKNNRTAFNIDNDAFPTLINAYQWRGRIKRKRGTSLLGRLQRFLGVTNGSGNLSVTILPAPITSGITSFTVGSNIFTDPGGASPVTLLTNGPGTATLNRTTGLLTITGSNIATNVFYYPSLPVMGLEDLILTTKQFPGTLGFDTKYSYNLTNIKPSLIYDVSFYKNPSTPNTQKGTWTPVSWNGADYQQFWTVNYQGALWATNGIDIPFTGSTIGMQYASPNNVSQTLTLSTRINSTTMDFTVAGNPLVVGDYVFVNEFTASGGGDASTINFQTGYVTSSGNTFRVVFPNANITAGNYAAGLVQYLTNRYDKTLDCIRWYDGDPTNGSNFVPSSTNGWVNFAPPLSKSLFSIADTPPAQYYLVGARIILPFKDRLQFIGPVIQANGGAPIYLQDSVIFSQNGTPFYTASFQGDPTAATTTFTPLLVPANQTATAPAYFEDQIGFGGYIQAGFDQPIVTAAPNEDVLMIGFDRMQSRYVYTGLDILPFNFFTINSELGSSSTFSSIVMDQGVLSRGNRGFIIANQQGAVRFDLDIPDQVFEIALSSNGSERVCSARDFINEWVYFTYPSGELATTSGGTPTKFPTQTLQYNYRDQSWAVFNESYTTYGLFRPSSGYSWNSIPHPWQEWDSPWNAGSSIPFQNMVIAGNQQGFVVTKADTESGTGEGESLAIQNVSGSTFTVPNHCLQSNDYFIVSGALGTMASQLNGIIFKVDVIDVNSFIVDVTFTGTYLGGGLIKRMYIPQIQTKQFPVAWQMSRKTRIGPQQYLLTTTSNGQITLLIFLSQNDQDPYNDGPILPELNSLNDSLIYSTVLYTCPESTNLGLTPANINLNMLTASSQSQIWHRMNTSLLGDTVQIGFTLSDDQMTDPTLSNQFTEIELHSAILDVTPSMLLA